MKINVIQFDPVIGGETTLTNALVAILKREHEVRIIHPVHAGKSGKLKINNAWGKVEGEEFLTYSQTAEACNEADFVFCVNAKHVKGSTKSDKRELAQADSDAFFEQFHNKDFIFYEHGFHTWRLYNYENLFEKLMKNDNSIRVLTNTNAAIEFYKTKGYNAYLCRQPFNTDLYKELSDKSERDNVKICFNSRYSSTKGPHVILKEFMNFFDKDLNFNLQFRGNISDPVSVWHNIDGVLLKDVVKSKKEIKFLDFAEDISDIYQDQDFCVYAGYLTREERGKIEYAILEPIYYNIPLVVHKDVLSYFRNEEYGISEKELRSSFIELTPENLQKIIDKEFNYESYVKNARKILEDFLPEKILERFNICISSPASKGRKKVELF
jgi:glycosyltransferase involved in cell wall biosynthesis